MSLGMAACLFTVSEAEYQYLWPISGREDAIIGTESIFAVSDILPILQLIRARIRYAGLPASIDRFRD